MNIIVCIKAVPASAQVSLSADNTLDREGAGLQWNVADEAALEAALRLKGDGTVTVLTMGPSKLTTPLTELAGRGVDRMVLLSDRVLAGADTYATARALAAAVTTLGGADLILCGRRALDGETGQVPPMIAAALGLPCVSDADGIEATSEGLTLTRRLENGTATLFVRTSAVVSVCEYAYPLRLPSIMSLRRARGKQAETLTAADVGLTAEECGLKGSLTRVVRVDTKPPGLRGGDKETDVARGVAHLRQMCREVSV